MLPPNNVSRDKMLPPKKSVGMRYCLAERINKLRNDLVKFIGIQHTFSFVGHLFSLYQPCCRQRPFQQMSHLVRGAMKAIQVCECLILCVWLLAHRPGLITSSFGWVSSLSRLLQCPVFLPRTSMGIFPRRELM
jgi:hypothetical protein